MARLTKIYTRGGDRGDTSLGTGERVTKDAPQVEAYGAVDELNSLLGVAVAGDLAPEIATELRRIQNELFDLGGALCMISAEGDDPLPRQMVGPEQVQTLEDACDRFNADLGDLENFILPGGCSGAAHLHLARTVCRRAERRVITFAGLRDVPAPLIHYLNRLSDLLFILARYQNRSEGIADLPWEPRG